MDNSASTQTQIPKQIERYQVEGEIGRGGMSIIYLAHDPIFDRTVAIKVLPAELVNDEVSIARFHREARLAANLEHEAIVPMYDFGVQDGKPYLVMRCLRGGSLEDRIQRGRISLPETLKIISRIAPALDLAHARQILHRDIKPSNILFDLEGKAYLSDFGIAKIIAKPQGMAEPGLTGDSILGTLAYISPELLLGEPEPDGRSDLYSLGIMLYEMLCGRMPYIATTPTGVALLHINEPLPDICQIEPSLPADIQILLETATAKDREARYPSAAALADALETIMSSAEGGGQKSTRSTDANRFARLNKRAKLSRSEPEYLQQKEACASCGYDVTGMNGPCPQCGNERRLPKA